MTLNATHLGAIYHADISSAGSVTVVKVGGVFGILVVFLCDYIILSTINSLVSSPADP